jgi:hypothetical protein
VSFDVHTAHIAWGSVNKILEDCHRRVIYSLASHNHHPKLFKLFFGLHLAGSPASRGRLQICHSSRIGILMGLQFRVKLLLGALRMAAGSVSPSSWQHETDAAGSVDSRADRPRSRKVRSIVSPRISPLVPLSLINRVYTHLLCPIVCSPFAANMLRQAGCVDVGLPQVACAR